MAKFLVSFSLLVLCYIFVEAVPKSEVFHTINQAGNELRYRETLALQNAIRDASARVTTPIQRACINKQISLGYAELNGALGRELVKLRTEFGNLTAEEMEQLNLAQVSARVHSQLSAAVDPVRGRPEQIRQCV